MKNSCDEIVNEIDHHCLGIMIDCPDATSLFIGSTETEWRWTSYPLISSSIMFDNLSLGSDSNYMIVDGNTQKSWEPSTGNYEGVFNKNSGSGSGSDVMSKSIYACLLLIILLQL